MLQVALSELVRDVRITLDENAEQSAYLKGNRDNLELDELIAAKIPEAARDITDESEVSLLEPLPMETTVKETDGGGILTIPEDFLRLVSLKMKGWNRSVTNVAGEGSDIEMMQRNKYTRGTIMKPVCVYAHDEAGNRIIEYFGKSTEVEKVLYMPIPSIETVDGEKVINISRLLRQRIVRRTAGLVLLSRGETQWAGQFLN